MNKLNSLSLLVACAFVALHSSPQPAEGASLYTYDFDALTPGALNGQDNWATFGYVSLSVYAAPLGGAPQPGSGLCLTSYGGSHTMYGWRGNDSNWSFDLTGAARFAMGNSMATDYYVSGYYGHGEYRITNSTTGKSIGFGIKIVPWYYAVYVQDAMGEEVVGTEPHPTARNQVWDYRMEVDMTAYGGNGAASLLVKQRGVHTEWQQVGGLESVNLWLLDAEADIRAADQINISSRCRITAMDDLWIEYIAAEAPLDIKPGSDPNSINLMAQGLLPVAILGSETFDVSQLDQTTLALGGASPLARGGSSNVGSFEDINDDGLMDLMLRFPICDLDFEPAATEARLTGELLDGTGILGVDSIRLLTPGDANGDGLVDGQDFTILKSNFGGRPARLSLGDFNEDGIVDGQDFSILKAYFGQGAPSAASPVPEPAALTLLAAGAVTLIRRRR